MAEISPLPIGRPEIFFSLGVYFLLLLCAVVAVALASWEKEDMLSFDLLPGWLGRSRDASDFEWQFWTTYVASNAKWFIGHALMSVTACRYFSKGHRCALYAAFSICALCQQLSVKQVAVLVAMFCCVFLSALMKKKVVVWVLSVTLLATVNISAFQPYFKSLAPIDDNPKDQKYISLVYMIALNGLRQISFAIDMCNQPQSSHSLLQAFAYVFYYPTLAGGPFISYEAFRKSLLTPAPPLSMSQLGADALPFLRPAAVWLFGEVILHHLYFSALQEEQYYLVVAPNFTVVAISVLQLSFFHVKYVFLYSVSGAFAKLDRLEAPPPPRCVLIQRSTRNIWRSFDVGLYKFLLEYIYKPLGGSEYGQSWQIVTSFVAFVYIGFWHGGQAYVIGWALINFLAISMERYMDTWPQTLRWRRLEHQLGPSMAFRLSVLLKVPVAVVSLWSLILFVGGTSVAFNLYSKIIRHGGLNSHLGLLSGGYFVMIALISIENWDALFPSPIPPKKIQRNKSVSPYRGPVTRANRKNS